MGIARFTFTKEQIEEINQLYSSGTCTQKGLAKEYGCSISTIHYILNEDSYKNKLKQNRTGKKVGRLNYRIKLSENKKWYLEQCAILQGITIDELLAQIVENYRYRGGNKNG